jgi:hypothetical protein
VKKQAKPVRRSPKSPKPAPRKRKRAADVKARRRGSVAKLDRAERVAAAMISTAAQLSPFGVPDEKWVAARAAIVSASTLDGDDALEVAADALLHAGKFLADTRTFAASNKLGLHELGHEALRATMLSIKAVPGLVKVLALKRRKKKPLAALVGELGQEVSRAVDPHREGAHRVVRAEPPDERRERLDDRGPDVGEGQAVSAGVRAPDLGALIEQST